MLSPLDGNTLSRIRQIRAQAIDKAIDKTVTQQSNWSVIITGALATACVMVFCNHDTVEIPNI